MFEIERVRDRERKIGYSLHKGTETSVRDRERFEIEGVRDRESQLYKVFIVIIIIKCFHYINHPNFSYLFTFRTSLCCPTSKSSVHFLALFSYFAGLISFLFLSDTEYLKFVAVKEFSSPGYIFHNKFTTTPLLNDIPEVRHIHRRKIDYDLMSHFHQTLPL